MRIWFNLYVIVLLSYFVYCILSQMVLSLTICACTVVVEARYLVQVSFLSTFRAYLLRICAFVCVVIDFLAFEALRNWNKLLPFYIFRWNYYIKNTTSLASYLVCLFCCRASYSHNMSVRAHVEIYYPNLIVFSQFPGRIRSFREQLPTYLHGAPPACI